MTRWNDLADFEKLAHDVEIHAALLKYEQLVTEVNINTAWLCSDSLATATDLKDAKDTAIASHKAYFEYLDLLGKYQG